MLNAFRSFLDMIMAAGQLVINMITSLFSFVTHIPQYSLFVMNALNILPNIVLPFAMASVTVSIVLFLINRQRG